MSDLLKDPLEYESILLAEDNDDHVVLIKRAFKQARFLNPLQIVQDGAEAIAYLNGDGKYADRNHYPMPGLLLLDLKMPNKNGFEVMEWIRNQPALSHLKIVVLTTTDRVFDVQRAYELGARSFLVKPLDFRDFVQLGPALKGFWIWTSDPHVREPQPAEPQAADRFAVSAQTPQSSITVNAVPGATAVRL
ncbi:MAG TPA: response regulator [Candidatus Binatia bacterium]|nr:response regulator [Candidatus Binatia bacterium]